MVFIFFFLLILLKIQIALETDFFVDLRITCTRMYVSACVSAYLYENVRFFLNCLD